jgi:hypothetical protein
MARTLLTTFCDAVIHRVPSLSIAMVLLVHSDTPWIRCDIHACGAASGRAARLGWGKKFKGRSRYYTVAGKRNLRRVAATAATSFTGADPEADRKKEVSS